MLGIRLPFKYGKKLARFIKNNGKLFLVPYKTFHHYFLIKLKKFYWQFSIKGIKMDDLMQSVFCPNSPIAKLEKLQWSPALLSTLCKFALHSPVVYFQIFNISLLILPCSGAFGRCFFREMNFGFSFKWSTLCESWDVQLFFDTLINAFKFKVKPIAGAR